jgi:hypothetical protein
LDFCNACTHTHTGRRSVGIVRLGTKAKEFVIYYRKLYNLYVSCLDETTERNSYADAPSPWSRVLLEKEESLGLPKDLTFSLTQKPITASHTLLDKYRSDL